ncbi:hypothetical protein EHR01_06610 [Leptospira mtsangambouensis]|uniref:Uncharacterized protein n=1 Tax=Leptospira mtsangambouensis TaxID=2484912 RepID=A0ABY2P0K5_9LEPT|nr:hypothetical protein [Leptospira mtsangambouensis]TGM78136.1 hypothetical protein EHR01_06610 [Leptospira mtsangambouensis]
MITISIDVLFENIIPEIERKYARSVIVDQAILGEVIEKINGYLADFKDPSEYKISGSITFWIRKLKPFTFELSEKESNPCLFLNEVVAVLYGYTYIRASKKLKKEKLLNFSASYLSDFSTQLRYSSFSPSSIALLYEAIYLRSEQI